METISLSLAERLILTNQFRILAVLNPPEAESYKDLIEITQRGFTSEYSQLFTEIDREELAAEQCDYVSDVLDMFWNLQDSYDQLQDKAGLNERDVLFPGFDVNNESRFLGYSKFRLKSAFDGFRAAPGINSHFPTRYREMLARYESIPAERRRELTAEEISSILDT
jgi:uncharacterized protein YfbU (UPF0304 family)